MSDTKLFPDIPEMPIEIINAIDNSRLLLFVGAGVSKLCGFPLWSELGHSLADKAIASGAITRSEKEVLFSSGFTPMQIITILSKKFDEQGQRKGIEYIIEELSAAKEGDSKILALEITKYLSAYNATIVTTNADETLENSDNLKDRVLINSMAKYNEAEDRFSIIHLHGSIREPDSMVFTSEQYARAYTVESEIGKKLLSLFKNDRTILFIGYGVAEFELIRYFLNCTEDGERKLFLLEGYLDKDTIKYEFDREYYASLGITLLPFSREKKDYLALVEVLKAWDKDVKTKTFANSKCRTTGLRSITSNSPSDSLNKTLESLLKNGNEKNIKTIINGLCNSEYCIEWILRLRDNEVLFSPKRNLKPCIQIDEKSVRSNTWEGLTLLLHYCNSCVDNEAINGFIIRLLNEAIRLYVEDEGTDPYLKLNSSSAILRDLLDIILSKSVFIDNCNMVQFVNTYLDGKLSWPYSLAHSLFERKDVLLRANRDTIFEVYKKIVERTPKNNDYVHLLVVPDIVKINPFAYYNLAKIVILTTDKILFDLGSFYEYKASYNNEYLSIYFDWFRISCTKIDEQTIRQDIERFMQSGNELAKKAALCLIHLRLKDLSDMFEEHITEFFNDECYYADLRCIMESDDAIDFMKNNATVLKAALTTATFGQDKDWIIQTLKNHLVGILNKKGIITLVYSPENQEQLVFAQNFNKRVYSIDLSESDDEAEILHRIEGKSLDEILSQYEELRGGSSYYNSIINRVISNYIIEHYQEEIVPVLNAFDADFVCNMLYSISNDSEQIKLLISIIEKALSLMIDNADYRKALPAIFYVMQSKRDDIGLKELARVFFLIKYEWISIEEYADYNSIITTCINEELQQYLEMASYLCQKGKMDSQSVEAAIDYYITNYDCAKLKSVLAYIYPCIFRVDREYAASIKDYVFDNSKEGKNLSYPLLAVSNSLFPELLDSLVNRADFIIYVKSIFIEHELKMAHSVVCTWLFHSFLVSNKNEDKVNLLFQTEDYDSIYENLRFANSRLETKNLSPEGVDRYVHYLKTFAKSFEGIAEKYSEIDQLIRQLSKAIVLLDNVDDEIWDLLFALFKSFNYYYSPEGIELIDRFKDIDVPHITKLLNMYFQSYDKYLTDEEILIKAYRLIKDNPNYTSKQKEWRVALCEKNEGLDAYLTADQPI